MGKQTLRDFTRQIPSSEDQKRFKEAMNAESDLVCAILQAIEIDYIIEQSIIGRLPRGDDDTVELLCKDNGPLATFFAKITLAYALNVYDEDTMHNVNIVRRIRNAFAHARKDISFASPLIRKELATIKLEKETESTRSKAMQSGKALASFDEPDADFALLGRASYVILCQSIIHILLKDMNALLRARVEAFRQQSKATQQDDPKQDK